MFFKLFMCCRYNFSGNLGLKNQKIMANPMTILCIMSDFEKRIPFPTSLLHHVRKDKCLRPIRCVFLLFTFTTLTVMRIL